MWMTAMWDGLQNDSISSGNTRWLMFFVGLVAVSMFAQAVVVIVAAIGAAKTQKRVLAIAEELRERATPILNTAESLVRETVPKFRTISDNLVESSEVLKAKAREIDATLTDANRKTRAQVARVDGMISTGLTAAGSIADMVHKGIRTPIIEAVGVMNGFKAGLDVLLSKSKGFANAGSVRRKTAISLFKDDRNGM